MVKEFLFGVSVDSVKRHYTKIIWATLQVIAIMAVFDSVTAKALSKFARCGLCRLPYSSTLALTQPSLIIFFVTVYPKYRSITEYQLLYPSLPLVFLLAFEGPMVPVLII